MKVVILAGGLGTRLSEETKLIPKPMVKIGNEPIILHIMNIYRNFGFNDFIIASGYKSRIIEKYFLKKKFKDLNIKVINTGKFSLTGHRVFRLKKYLKCARTIYCCSSLTCHCGVFCQFCNIRLAR